MNNGKSEEVRAAFSAAARQTTAPTSETAGPVPPIDYHRTMQLDVFVGPRNLFGKTPWYLQARR